MEKKLPTIPREEYPQRWEKVQSILADSRLDLLLAYSDDRLTYGNAYARYFADLPAPFEDVLTMFLPGREPALLVGPETIGFAQERSAIRDIHVLAEFAADDEDYPFTTVEPLRDVAVRCAGTAVKRVGIAGKVRMGAELFAAIAAAFPDAELVDVNKPLELLRGVKSPAELEVIRYAYRITNLGMDAALAALRPGVTEREIAAEAEYVMRRAGAEGVGIDTIVASDPNAYHILAKTTTRAIEPDDVVVLTFAPRYEGYHGACGRTALVGNPGEASVQAVEAAIRAQELCGRNLLPGKTGSSVEAMGRQVMGEAGYGENFLYSGLHSVGVIEFEPPILGPSSSTVIAENMVISVDIPLFEAKIPGVRMEDGYLITADGPRQLTAAPRMIRK